MMRHRNRIFIITTLVGIVVYSSTFLLLLGFKLISNVTDDLGLQLQLMATIVVGVTLAVVALTGAVLIPFDRTIAGRFLYISQYFAIVFIILSILAGVIMDPFYAAFLLGKYTLIGILVGNIGIVASNSASFFFKLPSVL